MATESSSSSSTFKKIRQELKDWERSFARLNGRSPAKEDIRSAPPSIYNRYRTYACLKRELQIQSKAMSSPSRRKRVFEDARDNCSNMLSSNDGESSDESEGSHISATPPKKKAYACSNDEVSSRVTKPQACVRNLSLNVSKSSRHVLCKINHHPSITEKAFQERKPSQERNFSEEGKVIDEGNALQDNRAQDGNILQDNKENKPYQNIINFQEATIGQEVKFNGEDKVLQEELKVSSSLTSMHRVGDSVAASRSLGGQQASKLGFAIKLLKHGEFDKENVQAERIPAGFFLNRVSSFRNVVKPVTSTILPKEPDTCDLNRNEFKFMEAAGCKIQSTGDMISSLQEQGSDNMRSLSERSFHETTAENVKEINKSDVIEDQVGDRSNETPGRLFTRSSSTLDVTNNLNSSLDYQKSASGASFRMYLEEMTVVSLRKMLSSKGLPTSGKKSVLVERAIKESITPSEMDKPRESRSASVERHTKQSIMSGEAILEEDSPINKTTLQKVAKGTGKKLNSTVEFINWNVVPKYPHTRKRLGTRENFVKLNIGKGGYKSHKFMNANSKRFKRCKFKSYRKRKPKYNSAIKGEEFEQCAEDTTVYDMDGNLLEENATHELANSIKESTQELTGMDHIHGSIPDYAIEAIQNPTDDNLLKVLRSVFGFKSFRPGQIEAIQHILKGESTMLVLPTGAGKSLSYQLPAYLLPGVTLVVSPLIAVMIDQLQHLPSLLQGAFLSSTQTPREYASNLDRLRSGQLKVLFVSPERFMCDEFLCLLQSLPCISLAVVDEAHCLSEWSHNFRPSYHRLGIILQQKLHLNRILAMTATASKKTIETIMDALSIPPTNTVQVSPVRKNLLCTASRSTTRHKDLLSLFQRSPFKDARSIIVYCNFQMEAENLSLVLHDNGIDAKSYHGGMNPAERKRVQEHFCSNKLRVVVATVAFGLGLDKCDVSVVIHYGLPNSLEHYMQETGRAGRNGTPAHCHLLLDDTNFLKLRSLAFSENVDVSAIRSLLSYIFLETTLGISSSTIKSIPIEHASKDLDLKVEVMATTLSYLEVDRKYISVLPELKTMCTLQFHKSSPLQMAKNSLLVDAILTKSREKHGEYNFELPSVANYMGLKLQSLQQQLQQLQTAGEISFTLKNPALCFHIHEVPADLDALASEICARFARMEFQKVKKLDFIYQTASNLAMKVGSSESYLQETVERYFESEEEYTQCSIPDIVKHNSAFLKADIKVFLQNNSSQNFTSRAIARVFHGISSPAYPSTSWSQNHFWGRHINIDFNTIKEAAESILGSPP